MYIKYHIGIEIAYRMLCRKYTQIYDAMMKFRKKLHKNIFFERKHYAKL